MAKEIEKAGKQITRRIHVVNLGAFENFPKLCLDQGLDLFPPDSGVQMYDIPLSGPLKPGLLEPWVHRIKDFGTFADHLMRAFQRDRAQTDPDLQSFRIIHEVIFCLPSNEVAKLGQGRAGKPAEPRHAPTAQRRPRTRTQDRAPTVAVVSSAEPASQADRTFGWGEEIRQLLKSENKAGSRDFSFVLFAASDDAQTSREMVKGIESLLARHEADENIHHSRNGIVAILNDDGEPAKFGALRLLIEAMKANDIWIKLRHKGGTPVGGQGLKMVHLLTPEGHPVLTSGEVIAATLGSLLRPDQQALDSTAVEATPGVEDAKIRFARAATNISEALATVVPTGMRDPVRPELLEGEGFAAPKKLQLVSGSEALGKGNVEAVKKFLTGLAIWHQTAVEKIALDKDTFADTRKHLNEIDRELDQFKAQSFPNVKAVIDVYDQLRNDISANLGNCRNAATGFADKANQIRSGMSSGIEGLKSHTSFMMAMQRFLVREAAVIRLRHLLGFILLFCILSILAFEIGARMDLRSHNGSLLDELFANPVPSDYRFWYKYLRFFLGVLAFLALLACVADFLNRIALHKARKALEKAAEKMSLDARSLPQLEFSARLNAYAASRLSVALSKLDLSSPDRGDDFEINLLETASGSLAVSDAYTDLRRALKNEYDAESAQPSPAARLRKVLKSAQVLGNLPKAELEVVIEGFSGDPTKVTQTWAAQPLKVKFALAHRN